MLHFNTNAFFNVDYLTKSRKAAGYEGFSARHSGYRSEA